MKAITVQQPWAELIAMGAKLVENRSRPVRHRGPLAIHAGMRTSDRGYQLGHVRDALGYRDGAEGRAYMERHVQQLTRGEIVAVADLVDCHPATGCCAPWGEDTYDEKALHHLVFDRVERLSPTVLAVGRLGLWDAPAYLEVPW